MVSNTWRPQYTDNTVYTNTPERDATKSLHPALTLPQNIRHQRALLGLYDRWWWSYSRINRKLTKIPCCQSLCFGFKYVHAMLGVKANLRHKE